MDLAADLKNLLEKELSALGYTGKPKDDMDTLLLRYYNVQARIPRRVSWEVKVSNEVRTKLDKQMLKISEVQGTRQFIKDAEAGRDLKPYLSDNINHPDFRDLMFYDWGIYHFHLSTTQDPKRPGFVKRTDQLLFAVTNSSEDVMYLIDIHTHDRAFENPGFIEIIENNWPVALDPFTLKGIQGTGRGLPSEQDVSEDRRSGLTSFITTPGGRLLMPMGGGLTTGRTSANNRIAADRDRRTIRNLQARLENARSMLEQHFKENHGLCWEDLDIHLTSFYPSVTVIERKTGTVLYPTAQGELHALS